VLDAAALAAIEEIKALKARYFRSMDTKDWPAFEAVFAPDATMDVSGELRDSAAGGGIIRGRATIAGFVRAAIDEVTTVHHGHMPEIEILSATEARGVWAMEDRLRWPDDAPIRAMHGFGHYHETYERHDGGWVIASTRLTRLRVDFELTET
jgi:hypothetical protein